MKIDDHLLAAYLNHTASKAERKQVEQWIRQDLQNQQEFERFESIWIQTGKLWTDQPLDIEASWERFQELRKASAEKPRSIQWRTWMARAAAVLLICTLTYVFWDTWWATADKVLITYQEQMSDITLPDGSRVWLNKHSQLSYPSEFKTNERRLQLSGEAYFEVVRDSKRPFLIIGDDSEVRVLGTSFNVNTTQFETEVMVNSGRVALYGREHPEKQVILQAGDKGSHSLIDNRVEKTKNQDPNYLSWKTGRLIFENMSLEQSLRALERHYSVKVTLGNPEMTGCRINTRFDSQPLEEVLEEIGLLLGAGVEQTTDGYVLAGDGCG